MAKETTKKLPAKPFTGSEGNTFGKDNQPSPEAKKAGWQQWRKERLLTQAIVKKMLGTDGKPTKTMTEFIGKLVLNANRGNPKAIDVLSKCLEDEIIKVAQTDTDGETMAPALSDTQLSLLISKINEASNAG